MKSTGIIALILISILYLVNPTAGIFELLPDNIPLVGNIDEFIFSAIALWSLNYLGIDVFKYFKKKKKGKKPKEKEKKK